MTDTTRSTDIEQWLDDLDADALDWEDTRDLAAIGHAADVLSMAQDSVEQARQSLAATVAVARSNGRSWADIGRCLGVTRQTAHERFADAPRA
ncbi:MAG: sigma-70 family RNA polymerase sigma factor [Euzebya sp.]